MVKVTQEVFNEMVKLKLIKFDKVNKNYGRSRRYKFIVEPTYNYYLRIKDKNRTKG